MDRYEEAFYAEERAKQSKAGIGSALDFVLWVSEFDPQESDMSAKFKALPETEQFRLRDATKKVRAFIEGNQNNVSANND
ncbi:MAG: hypothetical protein P8L17_05405 [Methylophilaceae bacterium]|nr:hypothetical protein [Methylophilaceae bacterium]